MRTEAELRDALRWGDDVPVDAEQLLARAMPASPRSRRRTRWVAGLAAIATATVGIFALLSTSGGRGGLGPAAFAVMHLPGDVVSIDVVSTEASAKQMTAQLHEYGLDITIETAATNRQLVGTWLWVSMTEDVPAMVSSSLTEQLQGYTATIELPASFPGAITLGVGRAARPGEQLQVGGIRNALAPGGLLFCERLRDRTPADVGRRLAELGYTVRWSDRQTRKRLSATPPPGLVTEASVYDYDEMLQGRIGDDEDTRDVQVIVRKPSDPLYEQQRWWGFSPSQRAAGTVDYSSCP